MILTFWIVFIRYLEQGSGIMQQGPSLVAGDGVGVGSVWGVGPVYWYHGSCRAATTDVSPSALSFI